MDPHKGTDPFFLTLFHCRRHFFPTFSFISQNKACILLSSILFYDVFKFAAFVSKALKKDKMDN